MPYEGERGGNFVGIVVLVRFCHFVGSHRSSGYCRDRRWCFVAGMGFRGGGWSFEGILVRGKLISRLGCMFNLMWWVYWLVVKNGC